MNKKRRAEIDLVIHTIGRAERSSSTDAAYGFVEQAKTDTESIRQDEQDALDNLPESFEDSDQYRRMEDAVDHLDDAIDSLDDALSELEDDGSDVDSASPMLADARSSLERAKE